MNIKLAFIFMLFVSGYIITSERASQELLRNPENSVTATTREVSSEIQLDPARDGTWRTIEFGPDAK